MLACDDEAFDVGLRGGGGISGVGEEGYGPGGVKEAQVTAQGLPETPSQGIVVRAVEADADASEDLLRRMAFYDQGANPAQRVFQMHPPLHDLHRPLHPA